jgi:hypothetical protein
VRYTHFFSSNFDHNGSGGTDTALVARDIDKTGRTSSSNAGSIKVKPDVSKTVII